MPNLRNGSSLDCESGILPLSYMVMNTCNYLVCNFFNLVLNFVDIFINKNYCFICKYFCVCSHFLRGLPDVFIFLAWF